MKYPKITLVLVSAGEPGLRRTTVNDALVWKHEIKEQFPDWKWRWSCPEKEELGSEQCMHGHAAVGSQSLRKGFQQTLFRKKK